MLALHKHLFYSRCLISSNLAQLPEQGVLQKQNVGCLICKHLCIRNVERDVFNSGKIILKNKYKPCSEFLAVFLNFWTILGSPSCIGGGGWITYAKEAHIILIDRRHSIGETFSNFLFKWWKTFMKNFQYIPIWTRTSFIREAKIIAFSLQESSRTSVEHSTQVFFFLSLPKLMVDLLPSSGLACSTVKLASWHPHNSSVDFSIQQLEA